MSSSLDIHNCEIGSVASRVDKSLAFRVTTPELTLEQRAELLGWHGRACRVAIFPHDEMPDHKMEVKTKTTKKTPSQKLRDVLFLLHQQEKQVEDFQPWYERQILKLVDSVKEKLNERHF